MKNSTLPLLTFTEENSWRDEYASLAVGHHERSEKEHGRPRRNNSVGVDGVGVAYLGDRHSIAFIARWLAEDRKLRHRRFTVGERTVAEAFFEAVKIRYEMTGRGAEFQLLKLDFDKAQRAYGVIAERYGLAGEN